MQELQMLAINLMRNQKFDALAVGIIDFKLGDFNSFEIHSSNVFSKTPELYFDIASLTKPVTLAANYLLHPEWFNNDMILLLNHRGGLPAWGRLSGRLSKEQWRNQINSYPIIPSQTLYSDYSALRLMLEIEKKSGKNFKTLCFEYLDNEIKFWKDIEDKSKCPITGIRNSKPIQGIVHDDNAHIISEFCSHAGLFGTINGICKTLLTLEKKKNLTNFMSEEFDKKNHERYIAGWDTVEDYSNTLAGDGAGLKTFGHLGFTGTSIWIDAEKKIGHVILTNATRENWYDRKGLNDLRKGIGKYIWHKRFF